MGEKRDANSNNYGSNEAMRQPELYKARRRKLHKFQLVEFLKTMLRVLLRLFLN